MEGPSLFASGIRTIVGRTTLSIVLAMIVAGLTAPTAHAQVFLPEQPIYTFTGAPSDGANPVYGHLIADSSGNLYGTTGDGGANGSGTVFELVKSGATYTEIILHSFASSGDDQFPGAGLIMDSSGNLYGTTSGNIKTTYGTVFELPAPLSAGMNDIVLHTFTNSGGDGYRPLGGLLIDGTGNLYGTTQLGGASSDGTVFELAAPLAAGMSDIVLHSFTGGIDGANSSAGLIMDSSGNLYGTTEGGGASSDGTVFELAAPFTAGMNDIVLHSFTGGSEGANPFAGLIMDSSGNLYGTTSNGGAIKGFFGSVFELAAPLTAGMKDIVLHNFLNGGGDGENPYGGLVMDSSGNLYGTTYDGGANTYGTVFELAAPLTTGTKGSTALYSFTNSSGDGANPEAGLIIDSSGNLYGTTTLGGSGNGTVFEIPQYSGPGFSTTTTLTSSLNPVDAGSSVTLTATVTSSGYTPQGTVAFYNGATLLGTVQLSGGTASVGFEDAEAIGVGTFTLTAQYTASVTYFASSSNTLSQTISEAGVVLTSGGNTLTGTQTVNGNIIIPSTSGGTFSGNGSGLTNVTAASLTGNISDTQVSNLLTDLSNTASSAVSTANTYANDTFLPLSGGTLKGALMGTSASFSGPLSGAGGLLLGPTGTATSSQAFNSNAFDSAVSVFNSTAAAAQNQLFRWRAEPTENNSASPSATLNLLFGANGGTPAETGLSLNANGTINFAAGQTFPGGGGGGSGTITGVTAGTGLTGGGTSGPVTLSLNTSFTDGRYLELTGGTLTGGLTATSFTGNGSLLTSLNPANLSVGTAGISITGNAATATSALSATVATTATMATNATNATELGGVAATKYARLDIANSFTGNQTVTGNETVTGNTSVTGTASVSGAFTAGTLAIGGGTPIIEHLSQTATITVPEISPNNCATLSPVTFSGASDGDTIALGIKNALTSGGNLTYFAWVSATSTVTIKVCNPHGTSNSPLSGTIRVDIWKH